MILEALESENPEAIVEICRAAHPGDIEQAFENPFVRDSDRVQHLEHPTQGDIRLVAPPVRSDEPAPNRAAPQLGEHTDDLLESLGYDDAAREALRSKGVV